MNSSIYNIKIRINGLFLKYLTDYFNSTLKIYNEIGQEVYENIISQEKQSVSINYLSSGIYFYYIVNNNNYILAKGKFVLNK